MAVNQRHPLAGGTPGPHEVDVVPAGAPLVIVPADTRRLEHALLKAPDNMWDRYGRSAGVQGRANGITNDNAVFGWSPPFAVRQREGCISCAPNSKAPTVMRELCRVAVQLDSALAEARPDEHARLHETPINQAWRFPGTGWTSAIINDSAVLPYHYDGGNTHGTWSAMAVIRRLVNGGNLHLPELDLTAPCRNGTAVLFNGQQYLHGVTPFTKKNPRGYRWTIVFYQRTAMTGCGTPEEELRKQQVLRTAREAGKER